MTYDEICDKQRTATYVFGYDAGYEIIRLLEIIKHERV